MQLTVHGVGGGGEVRWNVQGITGGGGVDRHHCGRRAGEEEEGKMKSGR